MFKRVRQEADESGLFTSSTRRLFTIKAPEDVDYADMHASKIVAETYVTTDDGGATQGIYPVNLLPLQQMIDNFILKSGSNIIDSRANNTQYCANYEYYLQDTEDLKSMKSIYGGSNDLEMDADTYHSTTPSGALYTHPLRHFVRPVEANVSVDNSAIGSNPLLVGGLREGVEMSIESSAPLRSFSTLFDGNVTAGAARQFPLKYFKNMTMIGELGKIPGASQHMIPYTTSTLATITGISQANPGIVTTAAAHGLAVNQPITIAGVTGMTQANGNWLVNTIVDATHFTIKSYAGTAVDTTGFGAYGAGGTVTQTNGKAKLVYACQTAGAATPTVLYSTLLYTDQRLYKQIPLYVGQKCNIFYRSDTGDATTYRMDTKVITALMVMPSTDGTNPNRLRITFDSAFTGTPATVTISPAIFDSTIGSYQALSVNWNIRKIELQLAAILPSPVQVKAIDKIIATQGLEVAFLRKVYEGTSIVSGGTSFDYQISLKPFTCGIIGMVVDPKTERFARRNGVSSYRYKYENVDTTTKDVTTASPSGQIGLWAYKLADYYNNESQYIACYAKRFSSVSGSSTSASSPEDVCLWPEVVPCTPEPTVLDISATYTGNTSTTVMFFHSVSAALVLTDKGAQLAPMQFPQANVVMPIDLVGGVPPPKPPSK